jgi:hypothetical protein
MFSSIERINNIRVIITGHSKYILYLKIVLLKTCCSLSLSKYRFGITNNVTADPTMIHDMIVTANDFRIISETIDVNHKKVVSVVSMIGCNLDFHASLIASVLVIHFS